MARHWGAAALIIGGLFAAGAAQAEPLTCATFRDRMNGALVAAADPGSEMPDYKDARTTSGGGSHANWDTTALSGSLSCGARDAFQEFYVSLDITSRDRFVEQLKRFVALNGAAICSTATAGPPACTDAGKALLQSALTLMGTGFQRRVTNPSGTSTRMLWPDLKAEITAAPSLITFSLAVPDGASLDGERRPLPPLPAPAKPDAKAPSP